MLVTRVQPGRCNRELPVNGHASARSEGLSGLTGPCLSEDCQRDHSHRHMMTRRKRGRFHTCHDLSRCRPERRCGSAFLIPSKERVERQVRGFNGPARDAGARVAGQLAGRCFAGTRLCGLGRWAVLSHKSRGQSDRPRALLLVGSGTAARFGRSYERSVCLSEAQEATLIGSRPT